ncbi:MAG TPA: hypothetical protein VMW47_09745 [Verrucomicrobiae bacterium]|nr:hypothetical protein [Verrucomicrobiae bacterium]
MLRPWVTARALALVGDAELASFVTTQVLLDAVGALLAPGVQVPDLELWLGALVSHTGVLLAGVWAPPEGSAARSPRATAATGDRIRAGQRTARIAWLASLLTLAAAAVAITLLAISSHPGLESPPGTSGPVGGLVPPVMPAPPPGAGVAGVSTPGPPAPTPSAVPTVPLQAPPLAPVCPSPTPSARPSSAPGHRQRPGRAAPTAPAPVPGATQARVPLRVGVGAWRTGEAVRVVLMGGAVRCGHGTQPRGGGVPHLSGRGPGPQSAYAARLRHRPARSPGLLGGLAAAALLDR